MKKAILFLLLASIILSIPVIAGADENIKREMELSYEVTGSGYVLEIPATFIIGETGASQTLSLTSNKTGDKIYLTLVSSGSGRNGSPSDPFRMFWERDSSSYELRYSITDTYTNTNVEAGKEWTFSNLENGVHSYTLEYNILSDSAFLPAGKYYDLLTFSVS